VNRQAVFGDETIRNIAGHVSRQMLKHYSHIGMEAKRRAVESLVSKKAVAATPDVDMAQAPERFVKDSTKVEQIN